MSRIIRIVATLVMMAVMVPSFAACDDKDPVKEEIVNPEDTGNPDESGQPEQPEEPGKPEEPETPEQPEEPETPHDPMADGKLCILAIGNSFSQDAVEQYLWNLFDAEGIEVIIGNMYIGGCTLETHWKLAQSGEGKYNYRKVVDGTKTDTPNHALASALADEPWDIVTLQQASGKSGEYNTYSPYLANMIGYVQGEAENAAIWFHQTWAYAQSSDHGEFPKYDKNQMTMYNAIMTSVQSAMTDNPELAGVIPSGTAVQNARTSFLGDTFNRDGYHLETTYGRYTAACTWFEALSGKTVAGNTYYPSSIDKTTAEIAQNAAHAAVQTPYSVTELTDYRTPPFIEGPLTSEVCIDFGPKPSSEKEWNAITDVNASAQMLKNADGDYTQVTLSIDPAFSEALPGVSGEPDNVIESGNITWPKYVWMDSFYVKGTAGAGDTEPVVITISGFELSQSFDVTILAARFNGTRTARKVEYTLVGNRTEKAELQPGIRLGSGDGRYPSWEDVPFEEYTFSVKGISCAEDGTLKLSVKGIDVGSTVVEGHISAMQISPAK